MARFARKTRRKRQSKRNMSKRNKKGGRKSRRKRRSSRFRKNMKGGRKSRKKRQSRRRKRGGRKSRRKRGGGNKEEVITQMNAFMTDKFAPKYKNDETNLGGASIISRWPNTFKVTENGSWVDCDGAQCAQSFFRFRTNLITYLSNKNDNDLLPKVKAIPEVWTQ